MLKELTKILEILNVYFIWNGNKEIIIPCPCDSVPYEKFSKFYTEKFRTQLEILKDEDTYIEEDEALIHVTENGNELSWLIEISRYSKEEEEEEN